MIVRIARGQQHPPTKPQRDWQKASPSAKARGLSARGLQESIAEAELIVVTPKQKVTEEQARTRRKADGFKINGGEIYVKPDRFKRRIPAQPKRAVLKEQKIILTEREDTATVERKIGVLRASRDTMPSTFAPCADWRLSE